MHVLVSGAGVAGNTLACFLGKAGIQTTLIEREASCLTRGHNIDIVDPAIKILDSLGLLAELKRRNTGEKGAIFENEDSQPVAVFPLVEGSPTSPTQEFEILRGDLSSLLYDASKQHESVTHLLGKTIDEVTSHTDQSVAVRLNDGSSIEADALILCDGQWSKLRTACFQQESISFVDKNAYLAMSTIPRASDDTNMWRVVLAKRRRMLSLRPDPHGTTRALLGVMPRNPAEKKLLQSITRADPASQKAVVRSLFSDAGWQASRILDSFDKADDFYFQSTVQVRMKKWHSDRIICLGDTAYAVTPFAGMGTTLAVTGAYLLAGELAKLRSHAHPSTAFAAYESMFRAFVEKQQDIPFFIPGVAFQNTQFGVYILRAVLWTIAKVLAIPGIQRLAGIYALAGGNYRVTKFDLPEYNFAPKKEQ